MDAEQALQLFDSLWFEREILKNNQEKPLESPEAFPKLRSIHTRSISEDLSSKLSFNSASESSDSNLFSPKLHTIFSSKDIAESITEPPENKLKEGQRRKLRRIERRRRESKSLPELEFEELKGFMDLGFVFSEEDRGSSLATIIPGLNRLGRDDDDGKEEESEISRPYLSEAWEALEREKEEKPLMINWRFPALRNEADIKDNLRWWAHTVASAVR